MRLSIPSLALLGVLAGANIASAGPLTISNVGGAGGWNNSVPGPGINITNQGGSLVDIIRWGSAVDGSSNQSGYDFDPVDGSFNPVLGSAFLLGTFTHHNVEVFAPSLESGDYSFSFSTNGVPGSLSDTFSFIHDETTNAMPCPAGPPGTGASVSVCDDFVSISQIGINSLITVGGDMYFFNLLGFSTNGGATIKNVFQSPEGGNNSAGLYAMVTPVPVPEPSVFLLLLAGGAAVAIRRRQHAAR